MTSSANIQKKQSLKEPVTTYHEKVIENCLCRVTSVFMGEVELGRALEDLTVKKILALNKSSPRYAEP